LAAKPKRVHRAARIFGAEECVGWAEGMIEAGIDGSVNVEMRPPRRKEGGLPDWVT
jgi:hypothetical protein